MRIETHRIKIFPLAVWFVGFLLVLLPSVGCSLFAQTALDKIDSLQKVWQLGSKQGADPRRLPTALKLLEAYSIHRPDSLLPFGRRLLAMGQRGQNTRFEAHGFTGLGKHHLKNGHIDSSLHYITQALHVVDPKKDPLLYSEILATKGVNWLYISSQDSALHYFNLALEVKKTHGYSPGEIYHNIGVTYMNFGDDAKALEYFQYATEGCLPSTYCTATLNSGIILYDLGLVEEAKANFNTALHISDSLQNTSLNISTNAWMIRAATNQKDMEFWLAKGRALSHGGTRIQDNIALLESAMIWYMDSCKYAQAKPIIEECLAISQQRGYDATINLCKIYMARIANIENRSLEAITLCRPVIPYYIDECVTQNLEFLYATMYDAFKALENQDSAFHYLTLKDKYTSLRVKEINRNQSLLNYVKYKTHLEQAALQKAKENAEALAMEIKKQQKLSVWIFILTSLFLSGVALFLLFYSRQQQKFANKIAISNRLLIANQADLKRTNEKLMRFSSIVSHDILSNLDLVLSTGNVLVGAQPKKETLLQYYQTAQRTNRQLKDYCLGLLEEARSEEVGVADKTCNPMPIIEGILARQEIALLNKGCRVELEMLSPTLLPPSIVEQVFQNLVSNAIRYGLDAPIALLRIGEEKNLLNNKVCWVVEDNGKGIAPGQREAIFVQSASQSAKSLGQGMGLRLLRETLQSYRAQIWVEERGGGGARFVVELGEEAVL